MKIGIGALWKLFRAEKVTEVKEVPFANEYVVAFTGGVEGNIPEVGSKVTEFRVHRNMVDAKIPAIPATFVAERCSPDGLLLQKGTFLRLVGKGDREYLAIGREGERELLLIPCAVIKSIVRREAKASSFAL